MKQNVLYRYLGTNGIITSPVHLEDAHSVKIIHLEADAGCQLTKDNKEFFKTVNISEDEVKEWKEVKGQD